MSKICIVCPSLNLGGAEVWTVSLANSLGAKVVPVNLSWDVDLLDRANHVSSIIEGDLIISWGVGYHHKFDGIPHVQVIHGEGDQARSSISSLKHIQPDYVAVSPAVTHMALFNDNVTIIPNGIDEDRCQTKENARKIERAKLGLEDNEIAVGFIGNFKQFKGVLDPVHAALADRSGRIVPILVGNDVSNEISDKAKSVFPRTRILSPRFDVGNIMAALDCFTLTSYTEAFSLALAEAWYCGVPTVATNVGAVPFIEKIFGQVTTKVRYMTSGSELADVIKTASENRPYTDRARFVVKHYFTAKIMADRWKISESEIHARALEGYVLNALREQSVYGTQWGDPDDSNSYLSIVLNNWLLPELLPDRAIIEIGSGGGRWSRYMRGKVKYAILIDDTWASEVLIRANFPWDGFWFGKCGCHSISACNSKTIDYVFSYDTFVHFDESLFDTYLYRLSVALKKGGKFHLHYAKLYPNHPLVDPDCFKYVEDKHLDRLLKSCGFERTGKEMEIHHGFGSKIIELVKI